MATNIRWLYQSLPNGCPLTDPHSLLYIHTHIHASIHPCKHLYIHASMHPCKHPYIHTSHTYIHPHIHTYQGAPFLMDFEAMVQNICYTFLVGMNFDVYVYIYIFIYLFIYLHIGKKLQAFLAKVLVAMCGHFYTHMRHYRRSHNPCRTHPEMDISRFLRITLLSKILPNSK